MFRPGPDKRVFYGWRIVAAGAILQVFVAGLFLQSYGAYVVPIQRDTGWSRTMLSAGFSMVRTESAILGPIQGYLIDRFGPRWMMRIGVVFFGVGFILLGLMRESWQFFGAMLILAIGASFAGTLSVTVAVVNWFRRRRATAIAMATAGFALGGLVVPAVAAFITNFGWRAAAVSSGALMLLVGPLVVQVIRHRPSDLGLYPDGVADPEESDVAGQEEPGRPGDHRGGAADDGAVDEPRARGSSAQSGSVEQPGFTGREALRTAAFWQLALGHGLIVMLVNALMVHLIPHLTGELGFSLEFSASIVALVTIMQLVGKFFGGWLGDRLSKRAIVVVAMAMHAVAALLLAVALSPVIVVIFAVLHGTAWGARGPLLQAWRADIFGSHHFGAVMGYSSIVVMLGAAGGPLVAGTLYDHFGSYTLSLQVLAVCAAVGGVLFYLVRSPQPAAITEG